LRNATVVVQAASRQPGRLAELVQCVFSADEIIRMCASDALEKVCRSHPASCSHPCRGKRQNNCMALAITQTTAQATLNESSFS